MPTAEPRQVALKTTPNSAIVLVLLLFFVVSLPILFAMHCRLIYQGHTTNEDFVLPENRPNFSLVRTIF